MTSLAAADRDVALTDAPERERPAARRSTKPASIQAIGLALALAALAATIGASLAYGAKPMSLGSVVDAFTNYDASNSDHLVVRSLRVPRTIVGLLVGVSLGLAGT